MLGGIEARTLLSEMMPASCDSNNLFRGFISSLLAVKVVSACMEEDSVEEVDDEEDVAEDSLIAVCASDLQADDLIMEILKVSHVSLIRSGGDDSFDAVSD